MHNEGVFLIETAADELYTIHRHPDMTYAVYNRVTNELASIGDLRLSQLAKEDADDFMALLNWLHVRSREHGDL